MSWITNWTNELNKMSGDILTWGNDINTPTDPNDKQNFFKRKKTRIYTLVLFSVAGILFYYIGFITLARICLIILVMQFLSTIWNLLKETFN